MIKEPYRFRQGVRMLPILLALDLSKKVAIPALIIVVLVAWAMGVAP